MPEPSTLEPSELAWLDALDTLSHRARLAAAGEPLPEWTPPENAGPLPEALQPLARSIIADQQTAIAGIRKQMDDVHGRGRVVRYMSPSTVAVPVYHDTVS
ncbi:hypothetical protein [Curtobacterium sp. MCBD17_040]|uniref:hypothetical protein n=1 Tax=Curtobacterium sp. MCBD17_040 TaxID=2175674 RepID=UPI000DA80A6F|nr:hypothetical protein [Curtobacterium sp. MCBD17_040]WIB65571.1 hypothetical protein DEI94_19545 [Curtobacterium sp. MCBD17_040]